MNIFKKYNNITGWLVFVAASLVYLLTMEPTASWWDCGEFIASGSRLEIGHPPGAPFFMLMGRFFSLFATDDSLIAIWMNALSALASSASILFLFWTITHLARKVIIKTDADFTTGNMIAILGSGVVGAMAFTFSDTFWFSAVEGEVYAASSFFTAIVFWAILKWEDEADQPRANRWLILLAYLVGLSIGVHLLNLLAIPAMVLVYYFKRYKHTSKGLFYTSLIALAILGFVQILMIPGIVKIAGIFELMAVNGLGLPYFSGVFLYLIILLSALIYGIYITHQKAKVLWNTILLAFTMILIGYSTFSLIVLRSLADPPLDENNPENFFALLSYINREQYGDRPLVTGPYYNAPVTGVEEGSATYAPINGKYEIVRRKRSYTYDKRFTTFFPRMHSSNADHIEAYKQWGNVKGTPIKVTEQGETKIIRKPTFSENLTFFFRYHIGHMYVRYFMWNFSGRQNDTQGFGDRLNGNWISGIPFIDEMKIGELDKIPTRAKNDPSRNVYYMLPFLLGLAGMFYHIKKSPNGALVVGTFFFMTGIAIILYLNQPPIEPRERDYTYAGSFYAFAIWIGIGVLAIYEWLRKKIAQTPSAVIATALTFILVPTIMGKENWDDHDRSGKYTARDTAYNYLMSCAPNAILFTNGDNDTFPLWYLQEVERIRTDVRVVNLMLLNTDWHIIQARRAAYDSKALPITLPERKYLEGTNDIIPVTDRVDKYIPIKDIIEFVSSDDERVKINWNNEKMNFIPTKKFILPVNAEVCLKNGTVKPELASQILPMIQFETGKNYFTKSELCLMDILANNNWERPIYFVSPGNDNTLGLNNYLQLEGYAYRLVPIFTPAQSYISVGRIETDMLYNNMMNVYKWGRMEKEDVFLSHFDQRTFSVVRLRNMFHRLAEALMNENKNDSALKVIDRAMEIMPNSRVPYDAWMLDFIDDYYRLGKKDKAAAIIKDYSVILEEELAHYMSLKKKEPQMYENEIRQSFGILQRLGYVAMQNGDQELSTKINDRLKMHNVAIQ